MKQASHYPITEQALRWIEVILAERFGHSWNLLRTRVGLRLQLAGSCGAIIFDKLEDVFTQAHSDQPFTWWDAAAEGWHSILGDLLPSPGVAKLPEPLIESCAGEYIIHYDIPGLIYWILTRVEEIGRTDLDIHERFPATSSHAYKHAYLDRPVVDEWLNVLGQVIQRQWLGIGLKQHQFQMRVSHDVDQPSLYAFKQWKSIFRMMAGHILKRRDPKAFFTAPYVKLASRYSLIEADPYNTFDWLMDVSEANGLRSAFYFICGRTHPDKDAEYEIQHTFMRHLLRRFYSRGHEIGLHPSYNTLRDPVAIKSEFDNLRSVCSEEGIDQNEWGCRMHYLRYSHPSTMIACSNSGISYDATLGYADHPGFRCGTCFDYPGFDCTESNLLKIRIRPLIMMESTVIENSYLGLGVGEDALHISLSLKRTCINVGGSFNLLWHNSSLTTCGYRDLYLKIIS